MAYLSSPDPLLGKSPSNNSTSSSSCSSSSSSSSSNCPSTILITTTTNTNSSFSSACCGPHRSLSVLSGHHSGPISSLALCGDFLISASSSDDSIVLWQYPFFSPIATFGTHSSANHIKSLLPLGNRVFSAHRDARIRVWKLSSASREENIFNLVATLPTATDRLSKIMKQSNYVQTRRNHRKLWVQHADTISCLAASRGLIYSGSWDKTLKVWRASDFKCLESIRAHDDAINAIVASEEEGLVYSASAGGKIKVWGRSERGGEYDQQQQVSHCLLACLQSEGFKGTNPTVCWNAVTILSYSKQGEGELVYGGGSDGSITGWQKMKTGWGEKKYLWRLVSDTRRAHESAVLCLCSVGEFVCSGSADKTIGVWLREEGGGRLWRIWCIKGHDGPVRCLQASQVGNGVNKESASGGGFMLYSGGFDKSLRVWWVPNEHGNNAKEEQGRQGRSSILLR